MDILDKILYRHDGIAVKEASQGMNHSTYWMAFIRRVVMDAGVTDCSLTNSAFSGKPEFELTDPVTNEVYLVTVTHKEKSHEV